MRAGYADAGVSTLSRGKDRKISTTSLMILFKNKFRKRQGGSTDSDVGMSTSRTVAGLKER